MLYGKIQGENLDGCKTIEETVVENLEDILQMRMKDSIIWLWKSARGWRRAILLDAFAGCVRVCATLAFIWSSKALIDIATGSGKGSGPVLAGVMAGCMVLQLLLSNFRVKISARNEIGLRNSLKHKIFSHIMESRWTGRNFLHTGDVMNRIEEDVASVSSMICLSIPSALVTAFQLCGALWILAGMDWKLAAILFAIMPVAVLLSKGFVRKMRGLTSDIRRSDSLVQSHIQENIQHRTLISALEYTSRSTDELNSLQEGLQKKILDRTDYSIFSRTMVQAGFSGGYLFVMLRGIKGLAAGTVSFGEMAAFLQLVSMVQRPVVDLSRQIPAFARTLSSVERLCELTGMPLEEQGEPIRLNGVPGIRFSNVTFSYPDGCEPVLKNFTYDFRPGSITSVTGETGAGKSTMVRLALALLSPDEGSVTIYDAEKEAAASPLTRCNITYVPQGNSLISGTIRENLLLGNPNADEAEMKEALHNAAADFIQELPLGLDTVCGESGTGLSEGQAQRIAIARGLLRGGRIMLLDEPASALDNATEAILMERLKEGAAGRTIIMITHREGAAGLCEGNIEIK